MKSTDKKHEFVILRAQGLSFARIGEKLNISKSTCSSWEKELQKEITEQKAEELRTLYETYGMTRDAKIRALGDVLHRIDTALDAADLSTLSPERLLDLKLKYTEALNKEYVNLLPDTVPITDEMSIRQVAQLQAVVLRQLTAGDMDANTAQAVQRLINNTGEASHKAYADENPFVLNWGDIG